MEVFLISDDDEIKTVIAKCLATDMDLVKVRHHSPIKTIIGCTEFTFNALYEGDILTDVDFYLIKDKGVVGFFAVNYNEKILRSFHVNKAFRNDGKCDVFWEGVRSVLGDFFYGVIWEDNKRAIRFFENEDGLLVNKIDNTLCYEFKK